jgi:cellulose synthase/poly-beta-1,6-N-acetylglucosamine synthase-like glycosyltransferase
VTLPLLQDLLGTALTVVALVLLVPAGVLLIQVLAAVLPERSDNARAALPALRPQVAVLVPAHDEAVGIGATLRSLLAQLAPGDRLLVVADNCSDDTAAIARSAGAEVIERVDAVRRGKGYALDFGIRHLEAAAPGVVVMVDADCALHPGSLERLVRLAVDSGRPVQALYLMAAPPGAALKTRIAEFAWVVKNQVRPLGFRRLGLPCQLMGSGMAFPWRIIRDAPLASAHIVEDMRLGLDLAAAGAAPLFCPDAVVTSFFPTHAEGIADQRARWERGHVGVILQEVPRAFRRALTQGRPSLAAMALDVSVPPLTILMLLLVVQAALDAALAMLGGSAVPLLIAIAALAIVALATGVAWAGFARAVVSLGELVGAPLYVVGKLPLYARFFRRDKSGWVRARRDGRGE